MKRTRKLKVKIKAAKMPKIKAPKKLKAVKIKYKPR